MARTAKPAPPRAGVSRKEHRRLLSNERKALKRGTVGPWKVTAPPAKWKTEPNWLADVSSVHDDGAFCAFWRRLHIGGTTVVHLAIRAASSREVPAELLQGIKVSLLGGDWVGVEFYPRAGELVETSGMQHLFCWQLPSPDVDLLIRRGFKPEPLDPTR